MRIPLYRFHLRAWCAPAAAEVRSGDLAAPLQLSAGDKVTFTIVEGADGTDNRIGGGVARLCMGRQPLAAVALQGPAWQAPWTSLLPFLASSLAASFLLALHPPPHLPALLAALPLQSTMTSLWTMPAWAICCWWMAAS